jgi:environmental stress-induced protein Ves
LAKAIRAGRFFEMAERKTDKMKAKITRRGELKTSRWSGGTTTQLAIFPETADYAARDFQWRISTARVESEESVFTPLPGFNRIIMVLEGHLTLTHEGNGTFELGPLEQNSFLGDWTTRSCGRVTDFNVMTRGLESSVEVLEIAAGNASNVVLEHGSLALYFLGNAAVSGNFSADFSAGGGSRNAADFRCDFGVGDVFTATLNAGEKPLTVRLSASDTPVKVIVVRIFGV